MDIHVFGSTTPSGQSFIDQFLLKKNSKSRIYTYSRKKDLNNYLDLNENEVLNPNLLKGPSIWISFAPIWSFSTFLESLSQNHPEYFRILKGIVVCSSTSVITKRTEKNKFDMTLVTRLKDSEMALIALCKKYKILCKIIRPTLIYGQAGDFRDQNLSKIINLMRYSLLIPVPKDNGLRQPIHASQLAAIFLKISNEFSQITFEDNKTIILNVGGDSELSYYNMLVALKLSLPVSDIARKCLILKTPNSIFYFLVKPLWLISPKRYDAIKRIEMDMAGFERSSEILCEISRPFPLLPLAK